MDISVTERQIFQRCPRQWGFTSFNQEALTRIDTVPQQFSIGTALHLAFSAHVTGLDPREVVQAWLLGEEARILGRYAYEDQELAAKLLEARELALDMIQHYYDFWGWNNPLAKQGLTYLAAEIPLRAPIPGTDGYLVGTLDGVAIDESGQPFIIEHKTYSQQPDRERMDLNDQMTAYMWLFWQVFGVVPGGVIYDGVRKKRPVVPKLTMRGDMSRQRISTTRAVYLRALLDNGLDPDDYVATLAELEEADNQEQTSFFTRWLIEIPKRSLVSFGTYLPRQYQLMSEANDTLTLHPEDRARILYPIMPWQSCWDCNFVALCRAVQFQEDYEYIRDTFYVTHGGHETMRAPKIERGQLSSFMDLRGHIPNALKTMLGEGEGETTT